jgi:hypothetical protein
MAGRIALLRQSLKPLPEPAEADSAMFLEPASA